MACSILQGRPQGLCTFLYPPFPPWSLVPCSSDSRSGKPLFQAPKRGRPLRHPPLPRTPAAPGLGAEAKAEAPSGSGLPVGGSRLPPGGRGRGCGFLPSPPRPGAGCSVRPWGARPLGARGAGWATPALRPAPAAADGHEGSPRAHSRHCPPFGHAAGGPRAARSELWKGAGLGAGGRGPRARRTGRAREPDPVTRTARIQNVGHSGKSPAEPAGPDLPLQAAPGHGLHSDSGLGPPATVSGYAGRPTTGRGRRAGEGARVTRGPRAEHMARAPRSRSRRVTWAAL